MSLNNADGPSFFDDDGNFILTFPDWETLVAKVQELEEKISRLENK